MASFWVSNINDINLLKFWPCKKSSAEENMNSITVLIIYIGIITALVTKSYNPLYIGIVGIAIVAIIYYVQYAPPEGMENTPYFARHETPQLPLQLPLRTPTGNNPFMNVPIPAYDAPQNYRNYNRYKEAVYPTPETENIRKNVETDFVQGLFQNPSGKLFERQNSQREFVSQPVGGVPSKQNEFAQWLYGKEYVCKSGSIYDRYGLKYTPDSLVCNGFNASEPTGWGRMDTM